MRRESSFSFKMFLGHLFGLMAFSGLLLAWYGSWIVPQEMRAVNSNLGISAGGPGGVNAWVTAWNEKGSSQLLNR